MTSVGSVDISGESPLLLGVATNLSATDALIIEPEGSAPTFHPLSLGAFGLLYEGVG